MKQPETQFEAGWSKQEFHVPPRGHAMHGYGGQNGNRAFGIRTPLYARAVYLRDSAGSSLVFCCLDLGVISYALRSEIVRMLQEDMGAAFNEAAFVLNCTHTHSAPGGLTYDAYYNIPTPGFLPDTLRQIAEAAAHATIAAWRSADGVELSFHRGDFADGVPVAWNRALNAFNRNPEVRKRAPDQAHLAVDRNMQVVGISRNGELQAFISLFGVHATCIGNAGRAYCGDNKGFAAEFAERALGASGVVSPVAIFAQGTAGDVSPHYHGPGGHERRSRLAGEAEYEYAERHGILQAEHALRLLKNSGMRPLAGRIDAILSYADFADSKVDPRYADGAAGAETYEPCIGVSMLGGTPLDGPGVSKPVMGVMRIATQTVKKVRLAMKRTYDLQLQEYVNRLYAAQGNKAIIIEGNHRSVLGLPLDKIPLPDFADPVIAEFKEQARRGALDKSTLLPSVLPLQIVAIGSLAIVCAPGEFTTTAGRRIRETMADELREKGIDTVLLNTYCNDYMGYATTREEYDEQTYEGGHTLYGQWTLAAFQTQFARLAHEFVKPAAERRHDRDRRPETPPQDELALRSNLPLPARR